MIITVAGTGAAGYSGDGGPATAATLNIPAGIAFDKNGNLLIADQQNSVIRKLNVTTGIITTIAGQGAYVGDGLPAIQAGLYGPTGLTVDNAGNILIVEEYGSIVRKIDAVTGIISTIAGVPRAGFGYSGDGGPARNGSFYQPTGIVLDASGNIYIADRENNVVREINSATGIISTAVGYYPGYAGYTGDGGPANRATLNECPRVALDRSGNLLIGDQTNNVIRKVDAASGIIHTIAGTGIGGYTGDGGPANAARLNQPSGAIVDANGNIYITDSYNNVIRKIDAATGVISTVAGNGLQGYTGDGGPALNASFYRPVDMAFDGSGNLYIADAHNNVIRKIIFCTSAAPSVSIFQSPATLCTSNPSFTAVPMNGSPSPIYQWQLDGANVGANSPTYTASNIADGAKVACKLTASGTCGTATVVSNTLIVSGPLTATLADQGAGCVGDTLRITASNTLSQINWYNGTMTVGQIKAMTAFGTAITVAGGNGLGAAVNQLSAFGMFVDGAGNIFVADGVNNRIQKWAPGATSGVTVAGGNGAGNAANQLNQPTDVFVDLAGNVYVADVGNSRIQEWAPGAGSGVTVAGNGTVGPGVSQFNGPVAVFVDGGGDIYVSDLYNFRVQKWARGATSGVTVAGGNGAGSGANQLNESNGIFVDASGNLYVADQLNYRIQKWAPGATSGVTVAGGNGAGSAANQLYAPSGVYVDANGNVFVADNNNNRVQEWAPGASSGVTVAGGNGFGSATDQLAFPYFVWIDASGNLYVTDNDNYRVQEFPKQSTILLWLKTTTPGAYTASITGEGGCMMTTNAIVINPSVNPAVNINAPSTTVCADAQVTFTAAPTNGGPTPVYQWQVNGVNTGAVAAVFMSNTVADKDVVTCLMTSDAVCPSPATVTSNSIEMTVNPLPQIDPMQDISLPAGQGITLNPQITGDVTDYLWSPGLGLSDSTIRDPFASPAKTTIYTLEVRTAEGCTASATVKVAILDKLRVPTAFTPNGDGRNDIFYVLGGPPGSTIKDFSVYDRWGQTIFQVHDVLPANPAFGWNGTYKGAPAPAGTYVYSLVMNFADGSQEVLKGTVILVR